MDDDIVRDHLEAPFHCGLLENASVVWSRRNPACGDQVTLSLRISDDIIIEAWHLVRGCLLCKASASILCEHLQSMPLRQAQAISEHDVVRWTGINITPGRTACCTLPRQTLFEAINFHKSAIDDAKDKV